MARANLLRGAGVTFPQIQNIDIVTEANWINPSKNAKNANMIWWNKFLFHFITWS